MNIVIRHKITSKILFNDDKANLQGANLQGANLQGANSGIFTKKENFGLPATLK